MDFYDPDLPEQVRQQALEAGVEPAVYALVYALGQATTPAMVCPVCDGQDWKVIPNRMDAQVTEVPARFEPADKELPFALLVCCQCRFVRLHYLGSI